MTSSPTRRSLLGAALALPALRPARAETAEIVIVRQLGTLYMQFGVMEQERLVERAAARLGLPGLRATYVRLAGAGPITDGLLSGSIHFAAAGAPAALLLWDRTQGRIRSVFAMNASNQKLLTVRPGLTAIAGLLPTDRIAVPAVKTSPQAIWLQMAAAQAFGPTEWARFDPQTVTRAHPDAMAAMLSGSEIDCHWSISPFQERALARPAVREIASSNAVMAMPFVTPNTIYGNAGFRADNPLAWAAVLSAFRDATAFIEQQPDQAAELYLKSSGEPDPLPSVIAAMTAPGTRFTLIPAGIGRIADFMATCGVLRRRPANLTELFFPEAAELGGS